MLLILSFVQQWDILEEQTGNMYKSIFELHVQAKLKIQANPLKKKSLMYQ